MADGDGAVNAGDIDCFVYAVVNGTVCPEAPADCYRVANDVNGDGSINAADIDAFVDAVVNGACE